MFEGVGVGARLLDECKGDCFGVGDPLPVDQTAGMRKGESQIFTIVVEPLHEGTVLWHLVTIVVDNAGDILDGLHKE